MKPVVTEKAVMMIERENVLTFETNREKSKDAIKKEIEELFGIKVKKIRSFVRGNKKYIYVKLKKEFPAIDIATRLGLM